MGIPSLVETNVAVRVTLGLRFRLPLGLVSLGSSM